MAKPIRFTSYARAKFTFLSQHGCHIGEQAVIRTLREPDHVGQARLGRWVAQRRMSERHVLRVIYEESAHEQLVVTFYPARRSRYESPHEI